MDYKPVKPMLCELQETPFNSPDYLWEPKYDGIRMITVIKDGKIRLFSRSGAEKTHLFKDLVIAATAECVLDGEVISGTSFNNIQHRANRIEGITQATKDYPAQYKVFDILELADANLMSQTLEDRKAILSGVLVPTNNVSLTATTDDGVALFDIMRQNSLEGVVGKHKKGLYRENKREWLKVKCWQERTFIAMGYTPGTGWRASTFGAIILCDAKGNHIGEVGTGFTEADIKSLFKSFVVLTTPAATFPIPGAVWFRPFPVKIKFLEFSNDGMLRFPVFKGVV